MSEHQADNYSGTDRADARSVSPYKAGLTCTCPNCGKAPLYNGLLEIKQVCEICGFDMSDADPGDGAQVFVILILGAIVAILGVVLFNLGVPKWAFFLILVTVIIGGCVWMLRVFKATLLALQYYHDAKEGSLGSASEKAVKDDE